MNDNVIKLREIHHKDNDRNLTVLKIIENILSCYIKLNNN